MTVAVVVSLVAILVNAVLDARPELFDAIQHGELARVRLLLDDGADIGALSFTGRSVLHEAALYGHFEIARLLIERGAEINARNPRGETPLFYAEDFIAGPPRTEAHRRVAVLLRKHGGVK